MHLSSIISALKNIPRTGWIFRKVKLQDTENLAQHTASVAILSMIFADYLKTKNYNIDSEKVVKMAIIHDLPEVLTFDISKQSLTYLGKNGNDLKNEIEKQAIADIFKNFEKTLAKYYEELFYELKEGKSLEAKIVKFADGYDVLIQIIHYENIGYNPRLFEEFWRDVYNRIRSIGLSGLDEYLSAIEQLRKKSGRSGCQSS